jgi:phage-related protein
MSRAWRIRHVVWLWLEGAQLLRGSETGVWFRGVYVVNTQQLVLLIHIFFPEKETFFY